MNRDNAIFGQNIDVLFSKRHKLSLNGIKSLYVVTNIMSCFLYEQLGMKRGYENL